MREFRGGMRMQDKIESLGKGSLIQHGKLNNRIYLMKLHEDDAPAILHQLSKMARQHNYTKIFCKVPKCLAPLFVADGFVMESFIPGFFGGLEDVFFMSKFLNSDRLMFIEKEELGQLSQLLKDTELAVVNRRKAGEGYRVARIDMSHAHSIASLYREVFESYPFPIFEPSYIRETMASHVQYFGAFKDGELAALGSSEMDVLNLNAEMTDFATGRKHKGNGLAALILEEMEEAMRKQGMKTLYTIARLRSVPMNKTFLKAGYTFSGTLIKNTNISGDIESMNVLYKTI